MRPGSPNSSSSRISSSSSSRRRRLVGRSANITSVVTMASALSQLCVRSSTAFVATTGAASSLARKRGAVGLTATLESRRRSVCGTRGMSSSSSKQQRQHQHQHQSHLATRLLRRCQSTPFHSSSLLLSSLTESDSDAASADSIAPQEAVEEDGEDGNESDDFSYTPPYVVDESSLEDPAAEALFFGERTPYAELGLSPPLVEALDQLGLSSSTAIQALAIPTVLAGKDVVIGAETGSGKTLAYLLPVLQDLMDKPTSADPPDELLGRCPTWTMFPEVIILAPNRELCEQVHRVVQQILRMSGESAKEDGITADVICGTATGYPYGPARPAPKMLVCTPVFLAGYGGARFVPLFCKARTLVMDEADMLLDGGYLRQVEDILLGFKRAHRQEGVDKAQMVMAAATLPSYGLKSVEQYILQQFPDVKQVVASKMHKHHPGIAQEFMRVDDDTSGKIEALVEVLQEEENVGKRTMVFTNTAASCKTTTQALVQAGLDVVPYHKDIAPFQRGENLDSFRTGRVNVLVCTDLAARGLDISGVQHIVQMDFALNVVQHLHRLGRAARAGRAGRATTFYDSKGLDLVRSIRKAMEVDSKLDDSFSRKRGFRKKLKRYGESRQAPENRF